MHLLNLTLQRSQTIILTAFGSFSAPKAQEIVVSKGKILEVLKTDDSSGKIYPIYTWECFGIIRSLLPFRLAGGDKDYIVIGSDSGTIVILEFNLKKNCFIQVCKEIFGKSGCRRIVPGQFLAKDPKGRAIMIGAVERQKLVYVLDRDNNSQLVISSPLQAHKNSTICIDMVGLDVEYENPLFACLEVDFSSLEDHELEKDERIARKIVTFYELDLGLNSVTRKQLIEVDPQSNMLISVPGGEDGPGGVLVCSLNWIVYLNEELEEQIKVPFPRRATDVIEGGRDLLIISYVTHLQKEMFFFLVQSEIGDLYKVSLEIEKDNVVDIYINYFDTVAPANSMCVSKMGFLFIASEFGNQYLFTFKGIGDNNTTSRTNKKTESVVYFEPRPLKNLVLVDEIQSLSPIIDMKVKNLTSEGSPQIYSLCGRGSRSTLRILRYGLEVTEMAVSDVPGKPTAVWTVKKSIDDDYDSFIVISFINATLVLSIGETVEEISDSGFLDKTNTLCVSNIGSNTLMQIHPNGIRLIRSDKRINEWKPPSNKTIQYGETNGIQVAIAVTGGEIIYFELDSSNQLTEKAFYTTNNYVKAISIAPIPEGYIKSRFMAIGGNDKKISILDLSKTNDRGLKLVSTQICENSISSLVLLPYKEYSQLILYAGTNDGRLVTSNIDMSTGKLSSGRQRYLGASKVKLFRIEIHSTPAVLALSSRTWMIYTLRGNTNTIPLSYTPLEYASLFSSEQVHEGIVSICNKTLRILTFESLGEFFHSKVYKLRYTPRKMEINPITNHIIIVETDHNSMTYEEKKELKEAGKTEKNKKEEQNEDFIDIPATDVDNWGSCLRIIEPINGKTIFIKEFENNHAAFNLCICSFSNTPNEIFLIVSTAQNLKFNPHKSIDSGYIHVYSFHKDYSELRLLHTTEVHDVPLALCPYDGMLLVGIGNILRLYDLGKKKLLKKSENRFFPGIIKEILVNNKNIYVSDLNYGVFFVKYLKNEKQFTLYADNITSRFVTSSILLDNDTVAIADKFGNFNVSRLPQKLDERHNNLVNMKYGSNMNAAENKLVDIVSYYVGETITSMQLATLNPGGGGEVILYGTIFGGIGCFYPLRSREDVEFYVHLESHMRDQASPICGNTHLSFRSSYFPNKACIDGDLCEQYSSLKPKIQKHIANEMVLDDTNAVQKRIELVRNHIL